MIQTALLIALISLTVGALSAQAMSLELAIRLIGSAVGDMRSIDTDGDGTPDKDANCFDVDLIDPGSGLHIGTASDCISDAEVLNPNDPACQLPDSFDGCVVRLIDTTFFRFNDGTMVSQGGVSIQPAVDAETIKAGRSHITGSFPTGNNITYGMERFEGVQGSVRLSGGVDMSKLVSDNIIDFDCLFILRANK